jgi:glycerol-3-phosphate acyltransferase PlsX
MDPLALEEKRIAVDAMGGDHAPEAVVRGTLEALASAEGFHCILVGDTARVQPLLARADAPLSRVEILHADEAIGMDEPPKEAVLRKPRASVLAAAQLLGRDAADGLVSAGSTGALILAAARHVPLIPGTARSGLAALIPARRGGPEDLGFTLLIDVGATVHATSRQLAHFATLGAAYLRTALGVRTPRVALLNIGEEATKGDATLRETYQILTRMKDIRFVGNVEGKDIPAGGADVVVCEGFTGNVVLKVVEGVAATAIDLTRDAGRARLLWRFGLGLLRPALLLLARKTDFAEYGGAPILGFTKLVVKAHGRSDARAIRNAILVAHRALRNDLVGRIEAEIAQVNETFFASTAG